MKNKYIIIALLLFPIFIISGMHLGNWINLKFPHINLNPFDIGNAEWLGFLGGYLGGVCTLMALIFTIEYNQKAMQKQTDFNKRALTYQFEIQAVANESKCIADAIAGLQPFFLHGAIERFATLPISEGEYDRGKVSEIIQSISNRREELMQVQIRLTLESTIYNKCSDNCKNRVDCKLYHIRENFRDLYYDSYSKIYTALTSLNEYIKLRNDNAMVHATITSAQSVLESSLATDETLLRMARENLSLAQAIIKDEKALSESLIISTSKLAQIADKTINEMIVLSKDYRILKLQQSKDRFEGKAVLDYEEDPEKRKPINNEVSSPNNYAKI